MKRLVLFIAILALIIAVGVWRAKTWSPSQPMVSTAAPAVPEPRRPDVADASNYVPFAKLPWDSRKVILADIEAKGFAAIFKNWVDAGRIDRDPIKQAALGISLASALIENKARPGEILMVRDFILNASNSLAEREKLVSCLSLAATGPALDVILEVAEAGETESMRNAAISSIPHFGRQMGDGRDHEELSPPLERLWQSTTNLSLLLPIARAMAGVGSERGITLLLNSALQERPSERQEAANIALSTVSLLNPSAVRALSSFLYSQSGDDKAQEFAADLLAKMSTRAAAQSLLRWAQTSDANVAGRIEKYVRRSNSPSVWLVGLEQANIFRSEENREAVRKGLNQYHADRNHEK